MDPKETLELDRFLPDWRLRQVDRIPVAAEPEKAWAMARHLDLYDSFVARFLFGLRTWPDRSSGRGKALPRHMTLDDIGAGPDPGFRILAEKTGREIVLGAIGRVWKVQIPFREVAPEDWAAFREPGFIKVAWNLSVGPAPQGGSILGVEVRVGATDEAAWRRFGLYWRLIGPFSHAIRRLMLSRVKKGLGALPPVPLESLALPGDGLIPRPQAQLTLAQELETPPEKVWPWLAQMGCRRGGWYSYDRLDNGGVPSAKAILPQFQAVKVGDLLPATPQDPGGFAVLESEPGRSLVLGSPELLPGKPKGWGLPYVSTWQFSLESWGPGACRLLVRVRAGYPPGVKMALFKPLVLLAHRFMERRQLANLKRRCEAAP